MTKNASENLRLSVFYTNLEDANKKVIFQKFIILFLKEGNMKNVIQKFMLSD